LTACFQSTDENRKTFSFFFEVKDEAERAAPQVKF